MHDYSDYTAPVSDNVLTALAEGARELATAEQRQAEAERDFEAAKAETRRLSENVLPELMDAADTTDWTGADAGVRVQIQEKVRGSISKANEKDAFDWLEANGHGKMVRRQIIVEFGKEDEEAAAALANKLVAEGYQVAQKRSVHASTLQAWARQMLKDGKEIPMQVLGIFRQRFAKVTLRD